MQIDPNVPRFQIEQTIEGIRIAIPSRRNIFVLAFLSLWLCLWFSGETMAISQLTAADATSGPDLFLYFWLIAWTLGGGFALITLLWQLVGKEIVTIGNGALVYRVQIFGIGLDRSYAQTHITGMRTVEYVTSYFSNQSAIKPPFFGAVTGPIAFDYGARTMRILPSMDEAEARILLSKLKQQMPASVFQ